MRGTKLYLVIGFLMGTTYAACGGAGGIADTVAETVGSAVDVVFSNSTSRLTATTVQGAIDEIDGRVDDVESNSEDTSQDYATLIVGSWSGSAYHQGGSDAGCGTCDSVSTDFVLVLSEDGSFTCSGTSDRGDNPLLQTATAPCDTGGTWEVVGHNLKLSVGGGFNLLNIQMLEQDSLELTYSLFADTYVLSKT